MFEGHSHYVMGLAINLKDPAQFASASLDHTVKIWTLGSASTANSTLEAHATKGVQLGRLLSLYRPTSHPDNERRSHSQGLGSDYEVCGGNA